MKKEKETIFAKTNFKIGPKIIINGNYILVEWKEYNWGEYIDISMISALAQC